LAQAAWLKLGMALTLLRPPWLLAALCGALGATPRARGTMLTSAIAGGKVPSQKRCLADAKRELNLAALPQECHKDIKEFYCRKVRDVASKRYTEPLERGCPEEDPELAEEPITMRHLSFTPAKLGYVILMHRYPENIKRLVMRLYEPEATAFAVHVDVKSPDALSDLSEWRVAEQMEDVIDVFSEFNVVRGGPAMLQAELSGLRLLLNSSVAWEFCILLSEQDYPLRASRVLAEYLRVHHATNFVSVDEGECERDVSFQCGSRVVSLSGGAQFPKIPNMRYGSGSQWIAITRELAASIADSVDDPSTSIGAIYMDLTSVKQPDESFFQAVILNSRFCVRHTDYTLHWTDKNSMREVRSDTSEYNILSPGVLHSGADIFKIAEVRKQALWAFFARKFDDSRDSTLIKNRLDHMAGESARARWALVRVPAVGRLVEVLASSMGEVEEVSRLDRNRDSLFGIQTLRVHLRGCRNASLMPCAPRVLFVRERLAMPTVPHSALALRVGCQWNKTELVFDGDVSLVPTSSTARQPCESLWAVFHWRMSRRPMTRQLMLVWVDPKGTPMQHAPITVNEHSVLLWHRYTATMPLPQGQWSLQLMTPERRLVMQRKFFAYGDPSDIPWSVVQEHFEVLADDPTV